MIISNLSSYISIIPFYFFARDLKCNSDDSTVIVTRFRRINAFSISRLFIWNLWKRDGINQLSSLSLVPSNHIRPSKEQRKLYVKNMHNDYNKQYFIKAPLPTHLLSTDLYASEYVVDSQEPLEWDGMDWSEIWKLLDQFGRADKVEHPKGYIHHTARYMHPLVDFHSSLVKEHYVAAKEALTQKHK